MTNFEPRVPMKIVLPIAPLVARSFPETFCVEIQKKAFPIKCNWIV